MSLAGINVLVTRPQGQAAGLVSAITALGANAIHYPVMEISALNAEVDNQSWQTCKQLVMELDRFQHVIFISGNAVHFGLEWIEQYWPQLPIGIQWYGIGKSTIDKMLAAGISVANKASDSGAMNSEQLLSEPALQQLAAQKVLIIRGVGGREYLAEQLTARGAAVNYAQCYRRSMVDKAIGEVGQLIVSQQINSLCVNSGESLQHLCTLVGPDHLQSLKNLLLVVPGQRVALLAEEQGFKPIVIASNASDSSMVLALQQAVEKQQIINNR